MTATIIKPHQARAAFTLAGFGPALCGWLETTRAHGWDEALAVLNQIIDQPEADEDPPMVRHARLMFAKARRLRVKADLLEASSVRRNKGAIQALRREASAAERAGAAAQQARRDLAWADNAIVETAKLAALRGDIVSIPSRSTPGRSAARRINGIDWLLSKNRLDQHQHQAADRYATDYSVANTVSLPTGLREPTGGAPDAAQIRRAQAERRLTLARERALNGHAGMIALCDTVIGEGKRIRQISNDQEAAHKNEAVLIVALDLLVEHYGIL